MNAEHKAKTETWAQELDAHEPGTIVVDAWDIPWIAQNITYTFPGHETMENQRVWLNFGREGVHTTLRAAEFGPFTVLGKAKPPKPVLGGHVVTLPMGKKL